LCARNKLMYLVRTYTCWYNNERYCFFVFFRYHHQKISSALHETIIELVYSGRTWFCRFVPLGNTILRIGTGARCTSKEIRFLNEIEHDSTKEKKNGCNVAKWNITCFIVCQTRDGQASVIYTYIILYIIIVIWRV